MENSTVAIRYGWNLMETDRDTYMPVNGKGDKDGALSDETRVRCDQTRSVSWAFFLGHVPWAQSLWARH